MKRVNVAFWALVAIEVALCWAFHEAAPGAERRVGPYVVQDAPAAPPISAAPAAPLPMMLSLDVPDQVCLRPRPDTRLLVFGASWCGPCRTEKPQIKAAAAAADLKCSDLSDADVWMIDVDESPKTTTRYQVREVPTYVLVDADGKEIKRAGGKAWRELLQQLAPAPAAVAPGMSVGTLEGGRVPIQTIIETLRPILRDGGVLDLTYTLPKGPADAEPAVTIAGQVIRLGNPTKLSWTLSGDVLRCQLAPPATVYVRSFPIKFRGLKITPERIVVDIPWLPDAEIAVR